MEDPLHVCNVILELLYHLVSGPGTMHISIQQLEVSSSSTAALTIVLVGVMVLWKWQ